MLQNPNRNTGNISHQVDMPLSPTRKLYIVIMSEIEVIVIQDTMSN